jgi:hypothetical protein
MKPSFFASVNKQRYKDGTLKDAAQLGYDTVQLKYDGWWSLITTEGDVLTHRSEAGREYYKVQLSQSVPSMTLVGEHMFGTQWANDPSRKERTYLFDIWSLNGLDLTTANYRDRVSLLRTVLSALPSTFEVVKSYPLASATELWATKVMTGEFEGLVYRKKEDPVPATIYREKYTFTEELIAEEFIEGTGKFAGTLGAVRCRTAEGVKVDVGGGFDNEERELIWGTQELYVGMTMEVEARKKFASGSLRHPNFVRWRFDKIKA